MQVVASVRELRAHLKTARQSGQAIGLVPTMGALHAGHLSLVTASQARCDLTAVTIFVNPTQFGPHEDFHRYPRPLEKDLDLCRAAGVDVVFTPAVDEVYPPGSRTFVEVSGLSHILEGVPRPEHFRGVATVVTKLLMMALPDVAFFGQKDFQQQLIIKRLTWDLNLPVEIETCPILRDPDGLAMSSRNVYLSPEQRVTALALSRALHQVTAAWARGERDPAHLTDALQNRLKQEPSLQLDYAVVADPLTLEVLTRPQPEAVALVAGRVGTTRLIDNVLLTDTTTR